MKPRPESVQESFIYSLLLFKSSFCISALHRTLSSELVNSHSCTHCAITVSNFMVLTSNTSHLATFCMAGIMSESCLPCVPNLCCAHFWLCKTVLADVAISFQMLCRLCGVLPLEGFVKWHSYEDFTWLWLSYVIFSPLFTLKPLLWLAGWPDNEKISSNSTFFFVCLLYPTHPELLFLKGIPELDPI